MESTIMGYIGTTTRTHSFIPNSPKVGSLLGVTEGQGAYSMSEQVQSLGLA